MKILKNFLKIFGVIFTVASLPIAMFLFDSGRQILLNGVTTYLKWRGIDCKIQGLNNSFSNIDNVSVKLSDNSSISFSKISLKKNGFFSKVEIHINNFIFQSNEDSKTDINFKNPIPFMKTLRTFINKIDIESGNLIFSNKNYLLSDVK